MDAVVPGGVAPNPPPAMLKNLQQQCDDVEREVRVLKVVYDEHAGLQDRFLTTGRVEPALAEQLGLTGLAGRASGQAFDLRHDHRWSPYDLFEVAVASSENGKDCVQVHGGMGYTWEVDAHLFLKRGWVLATQFGSVPRLAKFQ